MGSHVTTAASLALAPRKMLPSLPVRNSVLRQLGIEDYELPNGLARLKHNLLIPPSHTPSQESNTCANSDFSVRVRSNSTRASRNVTSLHAAPRFRECLKHTIAESPSHPDPIETFKSLHYLDQIALACLAAGCRDCQAPDCLQYRRKLESIVPVCRSWPGLWNWVLCITSCSLRTARDINLSQYHTQDRPQDLGDEKSKKGLSAAWQDWDEEDLLPRFRNHITACLVLTHREQFPDDWDIAGRVLEADINHLVTDESKLSGLIGRPATTKVSSRRCPHFTPEVLTCRRQETFALHLCVGPAFVPKHLTLYKREPALQVHQ